MKTNFTLLLLFVSMVVSSCGDKAKMTKLGDQKDSLALVVAMKDSIINDAFINIDEISTSLSQIAQRENLVTKQSSSEITPTTKEQINENIAAISDLLEKNRLSIKRLNATAAKLKAANVEIDGLQKLVASLQQQLVDKNAQIEEMAEQLKALNIEVAALTNSVRGLEENKAELEGDVAQKTEELNTVHYIVGNEKVLIEEKILDKQGGSKVLGDGADFSKFTKGDRRQIERINIAGKKVKVVSSHPQSSYMLVMGAKNMVEELVITDKDAFWKNSRVLVVSYK